MGRLTYLLAAVACVLVSLASAAYLWDRHVIRSAIAEEERRVEAAQERVYAVERERLRQKAEEELAERKVACVQDLELLDSNGNRTAFIRRVKEAGLEYSTANIDRAVQDCRDLVAEG